MKKNCRKRFALRAVLMAGVLNFAACSNDTQSGGEISMSDEEDHNEEVKGS